MRFKSRLVSEGLPHGARLYWLAARRPRLGARRGAAEARSDTQLLSPSRRVKEERE